MTHKLFQALKIQCIPLLVISKTNALKMLPGQFPDCSLLGMHTKRNFCLKWRTTDGAPRCTVQKLLSPASSLDVYKPMKILIIFLFHHKAESLEEAQNPLIHGEVMVILQKHPRNQKKSREMPRWCVCDTSEIFQICSNPAQYKYFWTSLGQS